ncbi:unnamed protein product [Menidia menidia]|uniref:(Atlantic silverside) hypothetical protein n=1 Tax=Menidia menidia TaxID=238744 RepID=A0A8S4B2C6_9TELE|nr:unnamed protein product [Menidia menidia]
MPTNADPSGDARIYQTQNPCGVASRGAPAALVTLDNLEPIAGPPWRRRLIRIGSLRNGYHIQGRQQARKLPTPDSGR